MKRTSKFCALLICALLWFNPLGAQQLTKQFTDEGTVMKMDKEPSVMRGRILSSRQFKMSDVQAANNGSRLLSLSDTKKSGIVKSYMRAAFTSKADGLGPNTFIGGAYLSEDINGFGYAVRFTMGEEASRVEDLENPIATADGLMGFPLKGTWNGQYFEGMWAAMNPYTGEIAGFFGYYIYEPVSNGTQLLVAKVLETGLNPYFSFIAYDYSKNKVLALQAYESETPDGNYVIDSIVAFQAAPNTGVYSRIGKVSGMDTEILAMTVTKGGNMYVIAADGFLYSVNTVDWSAGKVGNTGIAPMSIYQSMAADYRSDKLYWNFFDADAEYGMAEVNAATGVATVKGTFLNVLTCMSSWYYPDNEPAKVADFALKYQNGKVNAAFTVPALTVNGDGVELDTIEIFKVENGRLGDRIWAKQSPVSGEKINQELENIGVNGETVTLAVRTKDKNGKYSSAATANVLLFDITLPYVNGFEDNEAGMMAAIVVTDPDNRGGMERTTAEKHTGSYSFKMSGVYGARDSRKLNIQGMPVKKGGVYSVTFWAKTSVEEDGLLFAFDGAAFEQYNTVTSAWSKVSLTYEAATTGQMSLTLQGYGAISQDVNALFYIDDIEVKELVSPDVPAPFVINSVVAAPRGDLQAVLNITLPDKTMGEETLSKIDSIVFYLSTATSFTATNTTEVTIRENLTPGATKDVTVAVPAAGQYYVRAVIYNAKGSCPYYTNYANAAGTSYQKTPWIGSDMPTSVKVTATPKEDGTVELAWVAPKASHNGYIGTVSYKLKDAAGVELYSGSDLTFTTAPLTLGMHTLTLEFADELISKSMNFNTLAGIKEGMVYSNVATAGTYENRVLNVSASSENSAFSQMLYPATGKAMYIDTLYLFATTPTEGEAKQFTKIYMGTTDLTAFGGTAYSPAKDFVEKDQLTEVFADTLRFKAGEAMLKLPLSGFYYNGTQTLVISVVKPMQEPTAFAASAYVAVSENNMLKYRSVSNSIDFDTVKSYNDYTGSVNGYSVSMIATPGKALKSMEITVKEQGETEATPMADAIVNVVRDPEHPDGKNLSVTLKTDAQGKVTFDYVPDGYFEVIANKAAYIQSKQKVQVEENTESPVKVELTLVKAKEVKVAGTVEDKGGNKLAGVAVKAAGLADFTATTTDEGMFEMTGVYGPGSYTLSFAKAGMQTYSMPFELGETDTVLTKVAMSYEVLPVPMASVAVEDGKAVVKWNKPAVSTTMSWVNTITQIRRLTIDGKTAFKYAQRFTAEDLAALKLGTTPKALRFGFVPGSETARYSIVLAADTTHEIYRQEVPMDKLRMGEWCNIDIPADKAAINLTKELWLIVEVAESEDQGYACAATTVGTVAGKGNLMYYRDKWYTLDKLFESGAGNMLIRLLVEDEATQLEAANGYRVYRGLLQDEFKDYRLLTQETVKATTYTDADYSGLAFGQYNYAVVADFYGEDLAEPAYTNTLNKDMEFTVSFKVTSNAGSAKGATVYMVDTATTRDYEAVVDTQGNAVITKKVWRDAYEYEVALAYHKTITGILNLVKDTVINLELEEIVLNPELTASIEGKNVVINYGVNLHNWFDDVESYDDFAISNLEPWILSEAVAKGGVEKTTWLNNNVPQSWIVMNPSKTEPALSWAPYSGDKYFAALYNPNDQNNDYLIHPVSKGGGVFTFFVRAVTSQYPESFELVYSNTTSDLSAFKTLTNSTVAAFTGTNWARGRFNIPEDAKYIGIHCISNDAFGLLVDDLSYMTEDFAKPTGYEIYLDGTKVKDAKVDELTYTFSDLSFGEHKVGVKAIYASGASELVEQTVKVSAEAMPISLNAKVDQRTAVLTWDMPEGFAPKNYKVFLGNEQKAENLTEKTYTFSDLANGTYTASVVAVYETGESEKAIVEFIINSTVDVEDFDMAVRTRVYPNPSNGLFYLQAAAQGVAEVYTMNGQIIRRMEIPAEGVYTIDLQNRAKGMYLIRFVNNEQSSFFKVVVR
ncbi:MAG: choice-of-anchor J domain-containing protein [Bacteroides sp.]|nr:choice-of-anchor J domain-containing protein [Bacteroides sp.]MCM1084816.1 choice-of-anchor J domain-containing protein [Bacteroides sp.]